MGNTSGTRVRIEHLRHQLRETKHQAEMVGDAISHIDIDMANTIEEFVATTGKPAAEYHKWRKRARWAKHHKIKELAILEEAIERLKAQLVEQEAILYAEEAGYSGVGTDELLRAGYHLLMEIIQVTGYRPTASNLGVITAIDAKLRG